MAVLGAPVPFIWRVSSSLSRLSTSESEAPSPRLYDIRSAELKKPESLDHGMGIAFSPLIMGRWNKNNPHQFSWERHVCLQCSVLPLLHKPHFSVGFGQCMLSRKKLWQARRKTRGGKKNPIAKGKGKKKQKKKLVLECSLFKVNAWIEPDQSEAAIAPMSCVCKHTQLF